MPAKPADIPLEPHIARVGNNALQQTAPGRLGALRRKGGRRMGLVWGMADNEGKERILLL